MEASIDHGGKSGIITCYTSHKGETLEWNGGAFQRIFKKAIFEPFDQLNKFWRRLGEEEQEEIFQLYREARDICNKIQDVEALILNLRPVVYRLLDIHNTESFDHWARTHANIWIPAEMETVYTQDFERPRSREQTYLVGDYWELVFMVMRLRVIAPIWGEFVELTRRSAGSYTDQNAYYLILNSSVDKSPAMARLRRYVSKNVKETDYTPRTAIDGVGSDDFETSLIAPILVRYLVLANLTRDMSDTHLVQIVHKTLRNRLSQNESHQNAVLPKQNPKDESDSEDSTSRAEKYKNKPQVAPGIFTAIEKETEYMSSIARKLIKVDKLDQDDQKLLSDAYESALKLSTIPMEQCQLRLIQIVVNPIVVARALWDINKASILRLAAVAQFALWKYGFQDLASFVTASSQSDISDNQYGTETRSHIPKELQAELDVLYPYQRRHPTKKTLKVVNDAIVEIGEIATALSEHTWYSNLSDQLLIETRGSALNKTHRVNPDIRIRLAELVIFIQKRNRDYVLNQKY